VTSRGRRSLGDNQFSAYRIFDDGGTVNGRFVSLNIDDLDPGNVIVKVAYSSINFKDALASTDNKVVRRFPCVGGIDLSGVVVESAVRRFRAGDEIIATSYDLGVAHDGGYSSYCRLPSSWIVSKPAGLSLWETMALGTAGYTAGLALLRMERFGLKPSDGPILVSGATGGVGSLAIDILSQRGYEVIAFTHKPESAPYLKDLGAVDVLLSSGLDLERIKPLGKPRWGGAIDNLGGPVLAWMLSTLKPGGIVAVIGRAASTELRTTVMPWILRGVSALGISSTDTEMRERSTVWRHLATDFKPRHLEQIAKTIPFAALPNVLPTLLEGRGIGRIVVAINP
jgi:putative YhdH/YhfP family quinone oxidoreductase